MEIRILHQEGIRCVFVHSVHSVWVTTPSKKQSVWATRVLFSGLIHKVRLQHFQNKPYFGKRVQGIVRVCSDFDRATRSTTTTTATNNIIPDQFSVSIDGDIKRLTYIYIEAVVMNSVVYTVWRHTEQYSLTICIECTIYPPPALIFIA